MEINLQEQLTPQEQQAALEAVLFACGEPVSADRLCEALGIQPESLPTLLEQLERRYRETGSGLCVLRLEQTYQLATCAKFAAQVRAAMEIRRMTPLSSAAMEALTIVAYNQPVTKNFVERVRGVDSSSVVNTLVEKGLLEEAGRVDVPGRPMAYRTTAHFLRCFGLSSLEELPPLPHTETVETEAVLSESMQTD